MASDVDIANLALSNLGQKANISSLDPPEGSAHAETLAIFFPIVRDRLLQRHNWTWATKRQALASLTSDIEHWSHAYALPSDYLKAQRLLPELPLDDNQGVPYIIENGVLYANEPRAVLVYTFRQTDTTQWSPLFVNAMADGLAAAAAGAIVRGLDPRRKVELANAAEFAFRAATGSDATASGSGSGDQNSPFRNYTPSSIKARGSSIRGLRDGYIIRE